MSQTVPIELVRSARDADLVQTARLHQRGLPDGFFARIGWRFLRCYHRAFARSPQAVVLVAQDASGRLQGMLVGTLDNAAHYRWTMRRHGLLLALVGLQGLVVHPRLAAEFLSTRVGRYGRAVLRQLLPARADRGRSGPPSDERATGPSTGAPTGAPRVAVLTHVTVAEEARGGGGGRRLVEAFMERARCAGADEIRLITDAGGPAARFYQSLGWQLRVRRQASDGAEVEEYVRPL